MVIPVLSNYHRQISIIAKKENKTKTFEGSE